VTNRTHDIGIASQIGRYGDAVEVPANARWLFTAGTPGLSADGKLPDNIVGQAEVAWANILKVLAAAEMGMGDVVRVNNFLLRPSDIPAYIAVRSGIFGNARPASTLLIVPQLLRPEWLLEIEVCAAKA
jgi:2-iminobutanoate/2-iminopropanoate deaminase